jgi:hypothetical protein
MRRMRYVRKWEIHVLNKNGYFVNIFIKSHHFYLNIL